MLSQASRIITRSNRSVGYLTTRPTHLHRLLTVQTRQKSEKTASAEKKQCGQTPKTKKSRKLVSLATAVCVGTSIAVVAAKNDDDFREWVRENLPSLDSLVKVVYEEEETYLESLDTAYKNVTAWLKDAIYNLFHGMKGSGSQGTAVSSVTDVCEEAQKPYKPPASAFVPKEEVKEEEKTAVGSTPKHIKELKDLEDRIGHAAQDTIQAYEAVICSIKEQAALIDSLDQLVSKHDCKVWDKLSRRIKDEAKSLDKAESSLRSLESNAGSLKSRLEADANLTEDMKITAQNNLNILMADVNNVKKKLEREKNKAVLARRSWEKVRQSRMHFTEELETLFPNVWLNDEKLNIPADSMDPFVKNVLDNIAFLEKELAKLQTVKDAEVTSAIDRFKSTHESDGLVSASVCLEGGKEKRTQQQSMQKTLLTHKSKCEKNARAMMKQQAEVYADLKAEAISIKERDVERRMQQLLEEKLANLRAEHRLEVARMVGRIQGANEAINPIRLQSPPERGAKEKEQQEKQQFWSAAQSLYTAVNPLGVAAKHTEPKPLKNEINLLTKSAPAGGDELVDTVVSTIPQQAVDRGVQSENQLKQRFITLEKEARKFAAVPEGEITLLQLFLARVQSALYIDEKIPQAELNNEPIDTQLLNNYEILHRARHYVDQGQYDQAVRYLNLLKGPAQQLASDWIQDVVVYLETYQAVETLFAHASAARLQTD